MIIGAQLYTVRDFTQTENDFDETIRRIADIGYRCVQVSAIGDIPAHRVREICDTYHVQIIVTHTKQDRILNDTEKVIEEHRIMGAEYIGIGSMPDVYRYSLDGVQKFINDYLPAAQKIADAGLKLMYHNHHFEFEKWENKLVMDYLAESFSHRLLGFILDTYWVQAGGADPAFFIRKYAGRLETIHLKDMQIISDTEKKEVRQVMSPVLEGNLNWPSIFEACKEAKVAYAFVEQDDCNGADPFDCLRTSLENLKKSDFDYAGS